VAGEASQPGPATVTSTDLLNGLRDSDNRTIWQHYVDRYRPLIVEYALRLGARPDDAEDIAQQALAAFAMAYRQGKYDRDRGRLRHWLFGIVRRQLRNWYRRRPRREVQVAGDSETTGFFARLEDDEALRTRWDEQWRAAVLEECLLRVRAEVRPLTYDAFELFACRDWPAALVAEHLGVSEDAVFGAKRRVLRRVRELQSIVEELW
jgi:RNA polymerase sigma-70 factor (ECF subfamily)